MSEITVLVPCYNHASFVERCLRSIFAQTLHPKKLIVIDDGSTDNSAEVISKVLEDCPFPSEFISRENKGLCETLNEGFGLVDTEYFAYIGSDDIWLANFLEERLKLMESRPETVLSFGHSYLIDNEENIFDNTKKWSDFPDGDLRETLLEGKLWVCHSVLFRCKYLKKYEWNPETKLEDYEMYLKLSTEGDFAFDERSLVAWRIHGSNASGSDSSLFEEFVSSVNRVKDLLKLSDEEVLEIQKKLKFDRITQYIREGNKLKALSTLWETKDSANSNKQIANLLFRMSIPQKLFQWNRKRKEKNAKIKNGKLKY